MTWKQWQIEFFDFKHLAGRCVWLQISSLGISSSWLMKGDAGFTCEIPPIKPPKLSPPSGAKIIFYNYCFIDE